MVLRSCVPDLVIPKVTFSQYVLDNLKKFGDDVAMIDVTNGNRSYTYREVHDSIVQCACALNKYGIGKGDVVANCAANCAAYPIILTATAACGGILSTCNPTYTKAEILKQFIQSEPKVVFVDAANVPLMRQVAAEVKSIKHIFTVDRSDECTSFQQLLDIADYRDFPKNRNISVDDEMLLPYSSGTTGLPKGVMITHKNVVSGLAMCRIVFRLSRLDINYMVLPMFHIYGTVGTIVCLTQGVKLILENRFDIISLFQQIEKHKVTTFNAVPPILVAIEKLPLAEKFDVSSLREVGSGAAPLPDGITESVSKKYNVNIGQGWGLTEGVPLTSTFYPNCPLKSVGMVVPNTLLKVIDTETGKELGANQSGELCAKGPQIMKGYYRNPVATANTVDTEGWLHTGDIGYYDNQGFVYVIDRLKELIKVKGFQVAPAELEELILRHEKVADVGVIGVDDPESGELPKAFVAKKDDSLTAQELHNFLKDKVSKYKYLRGGITFVDQVPKTLSGKILRKDLRLMQKEEEKKALRSKY